jgi:hypothetical protein
MGGRGEQGLLHGILGVGEVAVAAHEHAEDLRRQFTHQVLDTRASGYHSGAGRS